MRVHCLEASDHGEIVLNPVLQVDGDAIPATLRHHLGREGRGDRQPPIYSRFAFFPAPPQRVLSHDCPILVSYFNHASSPAAQARALQNRGIDATQWPAPAKRQSQLLPDAPFARGIETG